MIAGFLRTIAVTIAVAGMVDPARTVERHQPAALTIAVLDGPSNASDDSSGRWRASALEAAERLRAILSPDIDARVRPVGAGERGAACLPGEACVLVTGIDRPAHLLGAGAALAGVVRVDAAAAPELTITGVESAAEQHPLAAGALRVHVGGVRAGGEARVRVVDGEAVVGETMLKSDTEGPATADVSWWPVATGPRRLTVFVEDVRKTDASASAARPGLAGALRPRPSARADVGVHVEAVPRDVAVYDTRPSWASTFVRRAIERDPRFRVRIRSGVAPGLAVSAGAPVRLDASTLMAASVVIVGAPEELHASDVEVLERFVRIRGGSLILLPDRPLSGPIARLTPEGLRERLERESTIIGPLRASEFLVLGSLPWGARPLASTREGGAVVLAVPTGEGRLVISGAMDAWRYRAGNEAGFDTFWRAVVADAAAAAGGPIDVTALPALAVPGEDVRIEVTSRSMNEVFADVAAGVEVTCEAPPASIVRLWPSSRGRLEGVFRPARTGACRVRALVTAEHSVEATTEFLVSETVRRPADDTGRERLQALIAAYGAREVPAGEEEVLAAEVRGRMPGRMAEATAHPMRSPWWIAPFVACLGGEWWLRRRRGLR